MHRFLDRFTRPGGMRDAIRRPRSSTTGVQRVPNLTHSSSQFFNKLHAQFMHRSLHPPSSLPPTGTAHSAGPAQNRRPNFFLAPVWRFFAILGQLFVDRKTHQKTTPFRDAQKSQKSVPRALKMAGGWIPTTAQAQKEWKNQWNFNTFFFRGVASPPIPTRLFFDLWPTWPAKVRFWDPLSAPSWLQVAPKIDHVALKWYPFLKRALGQVRLTAQDEPKTPPRRPQDAPRCLQDAPKTPQDDPKTTPRRPKTPPRWPQDAPKTPPGRPKTPLDAPRTPPRRLKTPSRRPQDAPRHPQDAPKTPQDALKMPPRCP